jgi:hypothetical protein
MNQYLSLSPLISFLLSDTGVSWLSQDSHEYCGTVDQSSWGIWMSSSSVPGFDLSKSSVSVSRVQSNSFPGKSNLVWEI